MPANRLMISFLSHLTILVGCINRDARDIVMKNIDAA